MDLAMVVEIISTLGFPIALTIACVWFFYKIYTWQRDDAKERELRDRETIEKFSHIIATNSEALLENAKVMEKINTNIEDVHDKVDEIAKDIEIIKDRQTNR